MTKRIKELEVNVAGKERQDGVFSKGKRYAYHGYPVYSFDRAKTPTPTDKEVWEEAFERAENYFLSFFTDQSSDKKAWSEARKEFKQEYGQTRLDKEAWSADVTARKERLKPIIQPEVMGNWAQSVGGVDFTVTRGAQPDIDKLEAGPYNFFITFYADDTKYKPTLRMTFEFDMAVGVEVEVPVGVYRYYELLSIVIRAIKDKFPFAESHKVIRQLREEGKLIRFTDAETGEIRWRPKEFKK